MPNMGRTVPPIQTQRKAARKENLLFHEFFDGAARFVAENVLHAAGIRFGDLRVYAQHDKKKP